MPIQRVLVPVQSISESTNVLQFACDLAQRWGAELHLLHVIPRSGHTTLVGTDSTARHAAARDELESWLQGIPPAGVPVLRSVQEGVPADEIIRYAEEHRISQIVMGTHGRSGLSHVMLGSVAERVMRHAPCPVLTIRPTLGQTPDSPTPETDAEASHPVVPDWKAIPGAESNRVIELLNRALQMRATDIHLDAVSSSEWRVRFRIDGRLEHYCHLDRSVAQPLLMQLKVMSLIDTAQPFEPHEGRLHLPPSMADVDVRITTTPSAAGGDAMALRLLKLPTAARPLTNLGFSPLALSAVQRMQQQAEGLVLVTGPTGSGKTTTVYSMLQLLDAGARNIVTIEDPVEIRMPMFRQINVDLRHGMTMTRGLRTLLRMDPDVVLIGEIRDVEALEIGMRAASSGRYVFSTLHTRDVASTVTALRDLRADNLSLASNLTGLISQRLVRRLCPNCREKSRINPAERQVFEREHLELPAEVYHPGGCAHCRGTGYRDRIGVYEVLINEGAVAALIQQGAAEETLRQQMRSAGTPSLLADALGKAAEGLTSVAEAQSIQWVN